jgi:hypothetical protein
MMTGMRQADLPPAKSTMTHHAMRRFVDPADDPGGRSLAQPAAGPVEPLLEQPGWLSLLITLGAVSSGPGLAGGSVAGSGNLLRAYGFMRAAFGDS